jgi:hypothetical protein
MIVASSTYHKGESEVENYKELISKISNEIVLEFIKKEKNLSSGALLLDADIARIVNQTGLETTETVLEETRDSLCKKKTRKG